MIHSALLTDFYALTMAQGYWKNAMDRRAIFEMFFRRHPFGGGFSLFAGLGPLLETLRDFSFSDDDIAWLAGLNFFEKPFLDYLRSFRFTGSLWAMDEGTVVFPQEPLIRISSGLIECQIIEGMLLNIINFQSLIATKTARVWLATGKGSVMEFGLRRAQGQDGAMAASRAAFIGGASGTSNVLAGKEYGIPVLGTMAHSWIMAFPGEEEAFQAYADLYPDSPVFLIDTYDTLRSGIQNAIKVGRRVVEQGKNFGVRLDSGDMHYLTVQVRHLLDEAGLTGARISVSNELDENIIQTLVNDGAPINSWGVGTRMVTGGDESSFTGVYKLTAREDASGRLIPAMKFSDNPEKNTNPGLKQVFRLRDSQGMSVADVLSLEERGPVPFERGGRYVFWHPSADYRHFYHTLEGNAEPLLKQRLENGKPVLAEPSLETIRLHVKAELETFDQSYKRILNPHVYKVSVTPELRQLKLNLLQSCLGDVQADDE